MPASSSRRRRPGAVVEDNRIEGNLYGVYLHGRARTPSRAATSSSASATGRMNEAGNGVSVWNAPGAKVLDNDIRFGRDGIFTITSKRNVFSGNRFRDLRFAIHYMYTNDSEVSGNVSTGNNVGFAIMYSHRLTVREQRLRRRPRPRLPVQLRQRLGDHRQYGAADGCSPPSAGRRAGMRGKERASMACRRRRRPAPTVRHGARTARRNASSSTTPTRTASAATGSRAARSASISPPAPRATRSPATPSSATATR